MWDFFKGFNISSLVSQIAEFLSTQHVNTAVNRPVPAVQGIIDTLPGFVSGPTVIALQNPQILWNLLKFR